MRIYIPASEFIDNGLDINDPNFSEIVVNYLQDNYFNGADNAAIYIGKGYKDNSGFIEYIFDLIPN